MFFSTTFGVLSVCPVPSLFLLLSSLRPHALTLCPTATCHQRASQPYTGPHGRPQQMSRSGRWGGGGTGVGGRAGRVTDGERVKKRLEKAIGLGHYVWADTEIMCIIDQSEASNFRSRNKQSFSILSALHICNVY